MTITTKQIKQATVQGAAWNYATYIGSKLMVFVTTIILARLLSPEDFGLLALGMILINYLDTVDGLGIGDALIYKQNEQEHAYNVAFVLNLLAGIVITTIGFFAAPLISKFFNEPRVTGILQILSLSYLISGIGSLLASRFRKELDFRSKFVVSIGKAIIKGGVSVVLALTGFGVWSLVWGQLAGVIASTGLYWIRSGWMPKFEFDLAIARSLFGYGWQMILVDVFGMIYKNVDYIIVGYLIGAEQLGFYTMGYRLPEMIIMNLCNIFGQTLFPVYSKLQNNMIELRIGFIKSLQYLSLLTIPAGLLMFVIAPEFVRVFYSEKWSETIPVFQALSIYAAVYSLSHNAGDIYKATGRPVLLNQIGVVKLIITIPAIWIAAPYGILYVAISQIGTTTILTILSLFIAQRIIGFNWMELLHSIRPATVSALIMFFLANLLRLQLKGLPDIISLMIVSVCSSIFYSGALWLTEKHLFEQVIKTLTSSIIKKHSTA